MRIMVINGVNLNMLAYRDSTIYGTFSYETLVDTMVEYSKTQPVELTFFVSNFEGEIVEKIHQCVLEKFDAIIINPAAFSHYSYAIYDALEMFEGLKVEVHLSDIHSRDAFRQNLVTALASDHVISGLQEKSYLRAIDWIVKKRRDQE